MEIKWSKIWEIVKWFGSRHPDLPSTIPFTYNQIEEAHGGEPLTTARILDILNKERQIKEAVDRNVKSIE